MRKEIMTTKNRIPLYEGDGFIHAGNTVGFSPRWEAAAELLSGLAGWIRTKSLFGQGSALDNYLARASSLADVERRLREVERDGRFFPG
jgi:hypothetical protein